MQSRHWLPYGDNVVGAEGCLQGQYRADLEHLRWTFHSTTVAPATITMSVLHLWLWGQLV